MSSSKLKKSIKSIINTLNKSRGSSKRFILTYTKPSSGFYYTTNVKQSSNNYSCDDSGWSYACANANVININKKTVNVSSNLQKRILFHEFLHVFGIDHVSQRTKGSSMTPTVADGKRKFSIKNYPKDLAAWRILNKPNVYHKSTKGKTTTYKVYFLNIYPYKQVVKYNNKFRSVKFYYYSSKVKAYQAYDSKGRITFKKNYYKNGRLSSYYRYYTNKKVRDFTTYSTSNIKQIKKSYYTNGIIKQYINYLNNGKYEEVRNYDSKGKLITDIDYYGNGIIKSNDLYYSNGKRKEDRDYSLVGTLIKDVKYFSNGSISEAKHFYDDGELKELIKYDSNGNIILHESY